MCRLPVTNAVDLKFDPPCFTSLVDSHSIPPFFYLAEILEKFPHSPHTFKLEKCSNILKTLAFEWRRGGDSNLFHGWECWRLFGFSWLEQTFPKRSPHTFTHTEDTIFMRSIVVEGFRLNRRYRLQFQNAHDCKFQCYLVRGQFWQ